VFGPLDRVARELAYHPFFPSPTVWSAIWGFLFGSVPARTKLYPLKWPNEQWPHEYDITVYYWAGI